MRMLTPHALSAGIATFTGVWAVFLMGVTPVLTVQSARPQSTLSSSHGVAAPKRQRGVLIESRETSAPTAPAADPSVSPTPRPKLPRPHAPRRTPSLAKR